AKKLPPGQANLLGMLGILVALLIFVYQCHQQRQSDAKVDGLAAEQRVTQIEVESLREMNRRMLDELEKLRPAEPVPELPSAVVVRAVNVRSRATGASARLDGLAIGR